jgi:hypothetical protein
MLIGQSQVGIEELEVSFRTLTLQVYHFEQCLVVLHEPVARRLMCTNWEFQSGILPLLDMCEGRSPCPLCLNLDLNRMRY